MTGGGVVMLNGCEALGGQSLVRCLCSTVDERTRRMNELLWCFLSRVGPEFLVKVRLLLLKRLLKETKEGQEDQLVGGGGGLTASQQYATRRLELRRVRYILDRHTLAIAFSIEHGSSK
jgi:hypothetical protein